MVNGSLTSPRRHILPAGGTHLGTDLAQMLAHIHDQQIDDAFRLGYPSDVPSVIIERWPDHRTKVDPYVTFGCEEHT
jgi:hypothetical protein